MAARVVGRKVCYFTFKDTALVRSKDMENYLNSKYLQPELELELEPENKPNFKLIIRDIKAYISYFYDLSSSCITSGLVF